ncbi:lambda exonuclease family protein, partial [Bartonella sp. AC66GZZY]|uniref:lambda exonuclease family protein n=1 Tax=Bartonella sp. AC66GZZY TaxID=3243458 RepID=UPI0035CF369E
EYAFIYDVEVIKCGFIQHPIIEMAGASPDGFVGNDGLVEVKCPQPINHIRFFIDDTIKPEYIAQMQFQMACTGRKWCDFMSYNPQFVGKSSHLCMKVKRINRDEKHIEEINQAVEAFLAEIEQDMTKILTKAA